MCGYGWDNTRLYGPKAQGEYGQLPETWELLHQMNPPRPDSPYWVGKVSGRPTLSLKHDIFDAISDNRYRWRDTDHAREVLGWQPGGMAAVFDPSTLA
jgi:hypothetical protein